MKVNLLVNYGWEWDLQGPKNGGLHSHEISRSDLIVRWGGSSRLSGFLPIQSVYADSMLEKNIGQILICSILKMHLLGLRGRIVP